jgi:hypothetical protein
MKGITLANMAIGASGCITCLMVQNFAASVWAGIAALSWCCFYLRSFHE